MIYFIEFKHKFVAETLGWENFTVSPSLFYYQAFPVIFFVCNVLYQLGLAQCVCD